MTITMAETRKLREFIATYAPCLTRDELSAIYAVLNAATDRIMREQGLTDGDLEEDTTHD